MSDGPQWRKQAKARASADSGAAPDGAVVKGIGTDEEFAERTSDAVKAIPAKPLPAGRAPVKQDSQGRFTGRQRLSAKEEELASLLAHGVPVVRAAKMAGYADPDSSGSRARRSPAVSARVMELQRTRLQRVGALAVKAVEDILLGKLNASPAVILDASKYILTLAGHKADGDKANDIKDLRAMSMAQLEAMAAGFAAAKAQGTAPHRPGDDAQPIDIIDEGTA